MRSMTVRDAMNKNVVSCDSSVSLREAARTINETKISSLVVVDFDCALGGIISQSDIVAAQLLNEGERSWDQITVGEIATDRVLTVTPDTSLREAAQVMRKHRIHQVAVAEVDDMCTPIGILSMGDILRYVGGDETKLQDVPGEKPTPAHKSAMRARKPATRTEKWKPAARKTASRARSKK